MAIQRSVQQQAAETRSSIVQAVSIGATLPQWLRSLLQQHSLSPEVGILVGLAVIDEQEGDLHAGIWLTGSLGFWRFEILVSRDSQETLSIEEFTNATDAYPVVASLPGTGPSFGYLARQVLHEKRETSH